jgi:hypothetical protein
MASGHEQIPDARAADHRTQIARLRGAENRHARLAPFLDAEGQYPPPGPGRIASSPPRKSRRGAAGAGAGTPRTHPRLDRGELAREVLLDDEIQPEPPQHRAFHCGRHQQPGGILRPEHRAGVRPERQHAGHAAVSGGPRGWQTRSPPGARGGRRQRSRWPGAGVFAGSAARSRPSNWSIALTGPRGAPPRGWESGASQFRGGTASRSRPAAGTGRS